MKRYPNDNQRVKVILNTLTQWQDAQQNTLLLTVTETAFPVERNRNIKETFKLRKTRIAVYTYSQLSPNKGKAFYDQEPPSGESTTTECGFNYQLLAVIY